MTTNNKPRVIWEGDMQNGADLPYRAVMFSRYHIVIEEFREDSMGQRSWHRILPPRYQDDREGWRQIQVMGLAMADLAEKASV